VEDEAFLTLAPPSAPGELAWNFGIGERFGYDVSQVISQKLESRKGDSNGVLQARDRNRGTFEFIAGKDQTALVIIKFHTEESFRNGAAVPREEIQKASATKYEAIATEKGTAEIKQPPDRADALFFFDAFLTLSVGERKLKDGWVRTKAAGFAKVGRYECVRLESEFEFSPTLGIGATLQRGRTIAWFALRERRFAWATTEVNTSTRTKARDKDGAWIVSLVDSHTRIRARVIDPP
jgi:hypothetical protein